MKIKTKSRIDHLEVLLRRVREASRINERTYWVRRYLVSFDAKLHATLEASDAMKPEDRPDPAELATIASGIDPWTGTNEPVIGYRKRKASLASIERSSNSESKTEPFNTWSAMC